MADVGEIEKILEHKKVNVEPKPVEPLKPTKKSPRLSNRATEEDKAKYVELLATYNSEMEQYSTALKKYKEDLEAYTDSMLQLKNQYGSASAGVIQRELYRTVNIHGKGGDYYLVKWVYPEYDVSWIPGSSIQDRETIDNFFRKNKENEPLVLDPLQHDESSRDSAFAEHAKPEELMLVSDTFVKNIPAIDIELKNIFEKSEAVERTGDTLETSVGKIELITPEYILGVVKQDDFVNSIIKNINSLYHKKQERYLDLYNKAFSSSQPDQKKESQDKKDEDAEFSFKNYLKQMFELTKTKIANKITTEQMRAKILDAVTNKKNGILSLTGDARKGIRDFLANQIYVLSRSMSPFNENFLNIALMGPAGTGKSKLAGVLAYVYGNIGVLLKNYPNNIIVGSAKDVIAPFSGQTVNKTNKFLAMGLESVIFIDEAYSIMSCNADQQLTSEQGYGPEAITEIVSFLDLYRGLSILVVAGYEKSMENCFFAANQGLTRRFPFQYRLESYSSDDLTAQFINTVNDRSGRNMFLYTTILGVDTTILGVVKFMINKINDEGLFPNQAGDVANLASIFATIIDSYPGLTWGESVDVNIFMLAQTYVMYTKQRRKPTPTTERASRKQAEEQKIKQTRAQVADIFREYNTRVGDRFPRRIRGVLRRVDSDSD
jgi:hypothetical protein